MSTFSCFRAVKAARVRRRCHWCGEFIDIGQPVMVLTGRGDDGFYDARFHPECHAAIDTDEPIEPHERLRGSITYRT